MEFTRNGQKYRGREIIKGRIWVECRWSPIDPFTQTSTSDSPSPATSTTQTTRPPLCGKEVPLDRLDQHIRYWHKEPWQVKNRGTGGDGWSCLTSNSGASKKKSNQDKDQLTHEESNNQKKEKEPLKEVACPWDGCESKAKFVRRHVQECHMDRNRNLRHSMEWKHRWEHKDFKDLDDVMLDIS